MLHGAAVGPGQRLRFEHHRAGPQGPGEQQHAAPAVRTAARRGPVLGQHTALLPELDTVGAGGLAAGCDVPRSEPEVELSVLGGLAVGWTCRLVTGASLHQYRDQLRLHAALNRLEGGQDLTTIGLDVGYSSHSHFTAAFRRTFGHPPSRLRRLA